MKNDELADAIASLSIDSSFYILRVNDSSLFMTGYILHVTLTPF